MAKTYEELLEQAAIIRDETAAGKNTATRVGGTITDAVDYVKELQDTYKGIHAEAAEAKTTANAAKNTAGGIAATAQEAKDLAEATKSELVEVAGILGDEDNRLNGLIADNKTKITELDQKTSDIEKYKTTSDEEDAVEIQDENGESIVKIKNDAIELNRTTSYKGKEVATIGDMPNVEMENRDAEDRDSELSFMDDKEIDIYASVGKYGIKAKSYLDIDGNPISTGNTSIPLSYTSSADGNTITFEQFVSDTDIKFEVCLPSTYNGKSDSEYQYMLKDDVYDEESGKLLHTGIAYDNYPITLPKGKHKIVMAINTDLQFEKWMVAASKYIFNIDQYHEAEKKFVSSRFINRFDTNNPSYLNKGDIVSIMHITDTHSDAIRWYNAVKLADKMQVDVMVHSGDICDTGFDSPHYYFTKVQPFCPVLACIGNHDKSSEANMIGELLQPLADRYGETISKTWYYKDINNVRFVILNVYDRINDPENWRMYYTQSQIDWLLNTLDGAISNGKSVVIVAHECDAVITFAEGFGAFSTKKSGYETYKTWEGNPICDIIEAYKSGGSINKSYVESNGDDVYTTINVSHSFSGEGEFVMWLTGHHHCDCVRLIKGYTNQIEFTGTCGAMRVHNYSKGGFGDDYLARMEGTYTENAFTGITINTKEKTVTLVRFGADQTYDGSERLVQKFNYINTQI